VLIMSNAHAPVRRLLSCSVMIGDDRIDHSDGVGVLMIGILEISEALWCDESWIGQRASSQRTA
jgi:hypothetical protein